VAHFCPDNKLGDPGLDSETWDSMNPSLTRITPEIGRVASVSTPQKPHRGCPRSLAFGDRGDYQQEEAHGLAGSILVNAVVFLQPRYVAGPAPRSPNILQTILYPRSTIETA
jgi:hypothetical protein